MITADTIEMRNGAVHRHAELLRRRRCPHRGGTLTINGNNMTISSDGSPSFTGIAVTGELPSGVWCIGCPDPSARAFSPFFQFADSASVTINLTGDLTIRRIARITTDSFAFGRSGAININAANM